MDPIPPPPPPKRPRGRPRKLAPGATPGLVGPPPGLMQAPAVPYVTPQGGLPPELSPAARLVVERLRMDNPSPEDLNPGERTMLRNVLGEMARREVEALRLFEELPGDQGEFFRATCGERLLLGGNRSGKTVAGAVEMARAVTGQDPYKKYPATDGRYFAVAKSEDEVAMVLWRKLSRRGAFKIIKDPDTLRWRAYRPWMDWDRENLALAKDAPPLIPRRFIASIAWENRKKDQPRLVKFTTGSELSFYSSNASPTAGVDLDGVWFDEEILQHAWYTEASARLLDRLGRFWWTATPQASTLGLYLMSRRAEESAGDIDPLVRQFNLDLLDNPHITDKAKEHFMEKMTDEEKEVRVKGKFAILGSKVYPEFAPKGIHRIPAIPIPPDWTIYISLDPGHQILAVLFAAVPPPIHEYGGSIVLFDELYLRRATARIFAEQLANKLSLYHRRVQEYLIDRRASRMTEVASGLTPEEQYSEALKDRNLPCVRTGFGFTWASDNVDGGILAVREGLQIGSNSRPKWLVMDGKLPNFVREADSYSFKKDSFGLVTNQPLKVNDHLMDNWRYLAMHGLPYVKPFKEAGPRPALVDYVEAKNKRLRGGASWSGDAIPLG